MLRRLVRSCISRSSWTLAASLGPSAGSYGARQSALQHLPFAWSCEPVVTQPAARSVTSSSTSSSSSSSTTSSSSSSTGSSKPREPNHSSINTSSQIVNDRGSTPAAAASVAAAAAPDVTVAASSSCIIISSSSSSSGTPGVVVRDSSSTKARIIHPRETTEEQAAAAAAAAGEECLIDSDFEHEYSSSVQQQAATSTAAAAAAAKKRRQHQENPAAPRSLLHEAGLLPPSTDAAAAAGAAPQLPAKAAPGSLRAVQKAAAGPANTAAAAADQGVLSLGDSGLELLLQDDQPGVALDTPEALEVIQAAYARVGKRLLPMELLCSAITNALYIAARHPALDPRDLLTPTLARMQSGLAQERAQRLTRMLPDTQLRAELLAKDPRAVSDKITRIVSAFTTRLRMPPPSGLLSNAWTFTKALRLPDATLAAHLGLLRQLVHNRGRVQQLAQRYTGVLMSSSCLPLLKRVQRVAAVLELSQDEAVELVLHYPFLARTQQQLARLEALVSGAPAALGLPREVLLPCLLKHPQLFRYDSLNALAHKYLALAAVFQGSPARASPSELLALCSAPSVRRAATAADLTASLTTAAAICGCSHPGELLPLLLQPPHSRLSGPPGSLSGPSRPRRPDAATLLQPAQRMAERAGWLKHLQGLSMEEVAKRVRWSPATVLRRDPKTQWVKLSMLEAQLLGRQPVRNETLAPQMTKMLKKCPWVANLEVETCRQRLTALEAALQLQQGQAGALALRVPQLLLLQPAVLSGLVQELHGMLLGDGEASRKLVVQDPKVLLYIKQARAGGFQQQLTALHSLLRPQQPQDSSLKAGPAAAAAAAAATAVGHAASSGAAAAGEQQRELQHEQQKLQQQPYSSTSSAPNAAGAAAAATLAAAAQAAVESAAARASSSSSSTPHGRCGVVHSGSSWWARRQYVCSGQKSKELRIKQASPLAAACASDLIGIALHGQGAALNMPASSYTPAEVAAMAAHVQQLQQEQQQQLRQREQLEAAREAAAAAAAAAAARVSSRSDTSSSGTSSSRRGFQGVCQNPSGIWESRTSISSYGLKKVTSKHPSALEAACSYDLARMAAEGPDAAVNLTADCYKPAEVAAMAAYLQCMQHARQQPVEQQQVEQQHRRHQRAAEQAAAAAAVAAAAGRAASSCASSSHGTTGIRKKRPAAVASDVWEMRSKLVHAGAKMYSSQHRSALEAACAFDLVRLAVLGPGAAVNLPAEVYTPEDVAAMAVLIQQQQKQRQEALLDQQQQQQQQQQGLQQEQQPDQVTSIDPSQQQPHLRSLFVTCLKTQAGRQLLNMRPETALARLQALADISNSSMHSILARALKSSSYLHRVLALSPARIEQAAIDLQQQLGLSHEQLQQLVQAAPPVLLHRREGLECKVQQLLPAFQECWSAVAAAASADSGSTSSSTVPHQTEQLQQLPDAAAGLSCLQRAVLYAPQLLGMDAKRVCHRLQVLREVCYGQLGLLQQLQQGLITGGVGRWLLAGDVHYQALQDLMVAPASGRSVAGPRRRQQATRSRKQAGNSSCSPLLQLLSLQKLLRKPSAHVEQYIANLTVSVLRN